VAFWWGHFSIKVREIKSGRGKGLYYPKLRGGKGGNRKEVLTRVEKGTKGTAPL